MHEIISKFKLRVVKGKYVTESSTVDGPGFRDVLWLQGCKHHCKGCHNPETWNEDEGQIIPLQEAYDALTKSSITHITLSGGDPVEQAHCLFALLMEIKEQFPNKTIWLYTGYTWEELFQSKSLYKVGLIMLCDVIVDGKFIQEEADKNLKFRGSKNQRLIDVKKTLKSKLGEIVLWEDENDKEDILK